MQKSAQYRGMESEITSDDDNYDDEDDDFTKWAKRQDGDKKEPIKCNCGAAKVGGIPHYEWCAIYNLEKVAPPLPRD